MFNLTEVWTSRSVFVLETLGAQPIVFRSDADEGTVSAQSEDGRLLAIVEPTDTSFGPSRTVIIGPGADAGLFVLCLVCSDLLGLSADRR